MNLTLLLNIFSFSVHFTSDTVIQKNLETSEVWTAARLFALSERTTHKINGNTCTTQNLYYKFWHCYSTQVTNSEHGSMCISVHLIIIYSLSSLFPCQWTRRTPIKLVKVHWSRLNQKLNRYKLTSVELFWWKKHHKGAGTMYYVQYTA